MADRVSVELVSQDLAGNALSALTCNVYDRDTTTNIVLYTGSTGGGTLVNPFTLTDGKVEFYINQGSYDVTISGAGITPVTKHVEAIHAENPSVVSLIVSGPITHTGTTIGFYGVTPAARSTGWNITNVSTLKAFDANAYTPDQVADTLGTLINYLKTIGLLGP